MEDLEQRVTVIETDARFSDLDSLVLELFREREMEILRPDGKARSRALKWLRPTDRIAFPRQLLLPGTSRRH